VVSPIYDSIVDVFSTRFNIERDKVQPDASFEDLGLDSLSQMELATTLEKRLGVKFTDDEITKMSVVSDIVVALAEKGLQA
jgi:acyl carrier protein